MESSFDVMRKINNPTQEEDKKILDNEYSLAKSSKSRWKVELNTIEECKKFIREMSYTLYFLAAFTILSIILTKKLYGLFDMSFLIFSGWAMNKFKSKALAIIIFLYSIGTFLVTFDNKINNHEGGSNIVLAFIFMFYSVYLIRAVFKYHKLNNYEENNAMNYLEGFKRIFVSFCYFIFSLIGLCIGAITTEYDNGLIKLLSAIIGLALGAAIFFYFKKGIVWVVNGFNNK